MHTKIGAGREIKRLDQHLWEGEQVRAMSSGTYGPGNGLIVLTDRRLLFVKDGMMHKATEDFPLEKVSSVKWSSGLMMGSITVFASGNKAEIKNVNKDDGKMITDAVRAVISGQTPPVQATTPLPGAPTAPDPGSPSSVGTMPQDREDQPDVYERLRKLTELRNAGMVTQEEFDAKKAELLSQM